MPVASLAVTVLDCPEPRALAGFYAGVLGGEIEGGPEDEWVNLRLPDGGWLAFQRAPGYRPPQWPEAAHDSQQAHLDLRARDIDEAQAHVLALGATALDLDDDGGRRDFRVFADPAGHPFCLLRPSAPESLP